MTSSNPNSSVHSLSATNVAEPLYQVKLLSALRSGNPALIHPFLAEIGKERRQSIDGDLNTGAAALHLAIRCASADTVQLLLSHRAISPNGVHPPGSGISPLHLAASLGRSDIVNILLEQTAIDDTIRDADGRTCKEVAKGREIIQLLEDSRSFLNASYRSLLRSYILSSPDAAPSAALLALLESPRVKWVDLSYLDDSSGISLLHEAARRKDLRLIELAVRAGADVFVRDRKGKMAYEGAGKDDRVRVFLRQFANHDTSLIDLPSVGPPTLKGYLNKYTNVARGYGTRWFVLQDGVLSYYRHQEDENIASRGAISMKTAILKVAAGGDKTRFEVHSTPSRGHQSGVQKWYLRANHPVEAARWTRALSTSMGWHLREAENGQLQPIRKSIESDTSGLKPGKLRTSFQSTLSRRKTNSSAEKRGAGSQASSIAETGEDSGVPAVDQGKFDKTDAGSDDGNNDDSSFTDSTKEPPHCSNFDLQGNSVAAQIELTTQLLSNISLPPATPVKTHEMQSALKDSLNTVQSLVNEYVQMVKDREAWWKSHLQRERERQTVWEESLQTVVREGELLEKELRQRSRKRGSRFFDASVTEGMGPPRHRPQSMALIPSPVPEEPTTDYLSSSPHPPVLSLLTASPLVTIITPTTPLDSHQTPEPSTSQPVADEDDQSAFGTDEEDEFFDAIEANTLPNLTVSQLLTSPTHSEPALSFMVNIEPYVGYKELRTRLPIGSDTRPSTSLWSVLKHSIGKDLTKISFPVFFNEPTSMLQRMAEDMEFSECLDVAARERDSRKRLAFVAAFAMSNYSSTIGRIAKPFNPMLGETFEYVRLDKEYRYMSEQVSHHPPISACWAESPYWHYYGEVDAQNKFMGKSFEIRPTGVAHVELLLPEEWEHQYPKATSPGIRDAVVEHYSWKKVTTNVSGFILGSPTIDHYGEMTVTNHRTGDQCILTFKPRGWRGKDAFEISGGVRDASGKLTHEIAGRWNSQLICRAVGTGSGFLHPDAPISGPASPNYAAEYVLLWRNSDKITAPFNLTPFAITLNDCPEQTLKPYLCPTDCRLRPDQRAFEIGNYELANELKTKQEEKQRATRKAREEGRLPPHQPRWFAAETDGDTGERVWSPSRVGDVLEYWVERERAWKQGDGWRDVDTIFIEDTL
ncbi:Oxysterol-binding protein-domain-containing protein [Hygrophoropsis aurantiaca]|uniref:Oxysterol-binding protein-domain-containing protein n=1 Tax=Hygrophoropsis aurantiaca TaxID=72124 RepID=A0ACB8A2I8_9AGAM|nr:Oxysterol-binding protein-domain-containing protein [Hygrophoropsis aurantiaca]